jgi:cytosine/adenosine deaminase-related metal-dependent hydrolase
VDEEAASEFERLEALGCVGANTLIVHGIALNRHQQARLDAAGAGLIWCPSSNLSLFGTTADVSHLIRRGRVALGTDSRLSGARDLLEELRIAAQLGGLGAEVLESLVTRDAARLLRLPDRGALRAGARADILILPAAMQLASATRSEVLLVMVDGIALYGDKYCAEAVTPSARWTDVRVDGRPKVLERSLAELVAGASAREGGLEMPQAAWRAA